MSVSHYVLAAEPKVPTLMELRTLPPYCAPRIGQLSFAHYPREMVEANAPAAKMWKEQFGARNYSHLHHYCFALNFMNKSRFEFDKAKKRHYIKASIGNFNYVLERWDPNFQLYSQAKIYKMQMESLRSISSGH